MNAIIVGTEDEEESTCFTAKGIKFWIMSNLGFRMCGTGFVFYFILLFCLKFRMLLSFKKKN